MMTMFWKRPDPKPHRNGADLSEQEKNWAREQAERDERLRTLTKEMQQFPDFASALAESLPKEGTRHE